MLREIHLHGHLRRAFGPMIALDVETVAEAVRALAMQLDAFGEALVKGYYRVVRGPLDSGIDLELDMLRMKIGAANEVHLIPVPDGQKKGGIGKIILGIAIAAVAVIAAPATGGLSAAAFGGLFGGSVSFGSIALIGAGIALKGISSLLTPTPNVQNYAERERPDERASFLFNGAVNTSAEGATIPVIYGRFKPGSVVISSEIVSEQK